MRPYCKVLPHHFSLDTVVCSGLFVASVYLMIVVQSFLACCLTVADLWSSHWCGKFTVKWETFSCVLVSGEWDGLCACRNWFLKLICTLSQWDLKLITYKLTDGENQRMKLIIVRVISSIFGSISGEAI